MGRLPVNSPAGAFFFFRVCHWVSPAFLFLTVHHTHFLRKHIYLFILLLLATRWRRRKATVVFVVIKHALLPSTTSIGILLLHSNCIINNFVGIPTWAGPLVSGTQPFSALRPLFPRNFFFPAHLPIPTACNLLSEAKTTLQIIYL